nr:amino acid ABC transporter permease [Nitrosomonas nitrosa]
MDQGAWIALLWGAWTTIWISGVSIVIGLFAGLGVAMLRGARIPVISQFMALYISVVRATPLITLVLFLFVAASYLGWSIDRALIAIAALTINTTAFNAEIWRSAFETFPREQIEASKAAGMTKGLMLRRIMLPQMTVTSLPPLVNEMTGLVKASPAIAMVGLVDLTRVTNRITAVTFEPLPPILAAGLFYILIIGVLVRLQRKADKYAQRLAM